MNEMRQKVNEIFKSDSDKIGRREETKCLVNEIKNKIQIFKEKRESQKETPKNDELNIDVNMDFLNKFKKIKTADEASNQKNLIFEYKEGEAKVGSNGNLSKLKEFSDELKSNPKESPLHTSNSIGINRAQNIFNDHIDLANSRAAKSFLQVETAKRNPSEDKKVVLESKKMDILETLSNSNKSRYNLNNSRNSHRSLERGIKDKIKNFVFEMDSLTRRKDTRSDNSVSSFSKEKFLKTKEQNELNFHNFQYTSIKPDSASYAVKDYRINELSYVSTKNLKGPEDPYSPKRKEVSLKFCYDDIKKLNSNLRFMPNEELRRLDQNLVDELIGLSSTISRMFEWRIKSKEHKLK